MIESSGWTGLVFLLRTGGTGKKAADLAGGNVELWALGFPPPTLRNGALVEDVSMDFYTDKDSELRDLIRFAADGLPDLVILHGYKPTRILWALHCTKRGHIRACLLYTSPSPRDGLLSRMPSSA